jgi:elongation factor P--beta-lysine ligase
MRDHMSDYVTGTIAGRREMLRRRAAIVAAIRHFFDERDYLAVETPQLCATPIPEAHIELFATGNGLFLLPSPEYHLKRLLAAGAGDLYEITHSFRNGEEIGPHHRREFTMLEYYTVGADSARSLEITRELLAVVASAAAGVRGGGARSNETGGGTQPPGRTEADTATGSGARPPDAGDSPAPADLVISMAEAWKRHTGIDLEATIGADGVSGDAAALAAAAGAGRVSPSIIASTRAGRTSFSAYFSPGSSRNCPGTGRSTSRGIPPPFRPSRDGFPAPPGRIGGSSTSVEWR